MKYKVQLTLDDGVLSGSVQASSPFERDGKVIDARVSVNLNFDDTKRCPLPTGTKKIINGVTETDEQVARRLAKEIPPQIDILGYNEEITEMLTELINLTKERLTPLAKRAAAIQSLAEVPEGIAIVIDSESLPPTSKTRKK